MLSVTYQVMAGKTTLHDIKVCHVQALQYVGRKGRIVCSSRHLSTRDKLLHQPVFRV